MFSEITSDFGSVSDPTVQDATAEIVQARTMTIRSQRSTFLYPDALTRNEQLKSPSPRIKGDGSSSTSSSSRLRKPPMIRLPPNSRSPSPSRALLAAETPSPSPHSPDSRLLQAMNVTPSASQPATPLTSADEQHFHHSSGRRMRMGAGQQDYFSLQPETLKQEDITGAGEMRVRIRTPTIVSNAETRVSVPLEHGWTPNALDDVSEVGEPTGEGRSSMDDLQEELSRYNGGEEDLGEEDEEAVDVTPPADAVGGDDVAGRPSLHRRVDSSVLGMGNAM